MAKTYANGREILSQGDHGRVTAAFPDVCNSPPSPPTGPVPVPYADSSRANDLKQGTKRVLIQGKPVGVRDQSYLASSPLGDEAATKSLGGNLVSHQSAGKTYFGSWSLDVEAEGKGVLRHLDLTTSNHGSYPGGTPPFPNLGAMHRLALSRIGEKQCPCCGERSCAAAFKADEEPLSMREAFGLDPRASNYNPARHQEFKTLRMIKKQDCTCDGKVFPSPPCDVFRTPDPCRHSAIEEAWNTHRDTYTQWYKDSYGVELQGSTHFAALFMAMESPASRAAMDVAGKLSKAERRALPAGLKRDSILAEAKKLERINHLTPKKAGGCPTNPDNLQPQQTLCEACQGIDQFMTDNW